MAIHSSLQGTTDRAGYDRPRVVVRFREGVRLADHPDLGEQIEQTGIGPWRRLLAQFPGLKLSRVFIVLASGALRDLQRRAAAMDRSYRPADFDTFFYVDAPPDTDLVELVRALLRWNSVQTAYIDQGGPDPAVNAANDPRAVNQGYLDPAPDGIDAEYAWNFAGGDGAGQRFIDLERGWTLNHEDLAAHGAALLHGTLLDSSRAHGTAVLGEICAVDNAGGCIGIAPNIASVNVVSFDGSTRPNALIAAIGSLGFGDTLLVEAQVALNGTALLGPIEAYDAEYEAIRLATALGIIVVEAGGNGTDNGGIPALNMDTYTTLGGQAILNRDPGNRQFRDSGAIIVTAASAAAPHTRLAYGPYGKRIDCYAWGQGINTCSSDATGSTTAYTSGFGGTSGAAPIVTGAALAVQGRAQAQLGYRLSPGQMRAVLSDPATGTLPSATEPTRIRVMPDLRKIFDAYFNAGPRLYLRDAVGDPGLPHTGAISASPDIILRPTPVAVPQDCFGAGSGTENDAGLGCKAEAGQDNYVYVRVLNQGGSNAVNVQATVYWAPVATLVTPDLWTLLGVTVLPEVPAGDLLTVSDPIGWPALAIPAPGHYCFVGLVGTRGSPAPGPADLLDFDHFRRFIRENHNVSWRNFNVEDNDPDVNDPSVPRGFKALPFLAPGAPDRAREMALEVVARLPEGARAVLEVPLVYFEMLSERTQYGRVKIDRERRVAFLALNASGRTAFGALPFPARSRMAMRLLVEIPAPYRGRTFRVYARQLFEREEVGRVTWQLGPRREGN